MNPVEDLAKIQKLREQIKRMQYAIHKLAGWQGVDISDLIEDELLNEGDMD